MKNGACGDNPRAPGSSSLVGSHSTRDDPSVMWDYSLSPDGRYVAYPAEIQRGSSIWRIDLPR